MGRFFLVCIEDLAKGTEKIRDRTYRFLENVTLVYDNIFQKFHLLSPRHFLPRSSHKKMASNPSKRWLFKKNGASALLRRAGEQIRKGKTHTTRGCLASGHTGRQLSFPKGQTGSTKRHTALANKTQMGEKACGKKHIYTGRQKRQIESSYGRTPMFPFLD